MDKLAIGKVRTSTGVHGYVKVLSFSGEVSHFRKLKGQEIELRRDGRTKFCMIEDVRMSGSSPTMKISGVESPEEAKKFSGWELYVERDKAAVLNSGEYYLADLCKCRLIFDGKTVGVVKAISDNGISDLLEIDNEGKTVLIPFMEQYIGAVDIEAGTIELIEGWLLE